MVFNKKIFKRRRFLGIFKNIDVLSEISVFHRSVGIAKGRFLLASLLFRKAILIN